MKKVSTWLLDKPQHAPAAALVLSLLPIVGMTLISALSVSIIVGFLTLEQGVKAGAKVLVWAMIPSVALLFLRVIGMVDYVLFQSLFVWLSCALYLRFRSWTLVVESLTIAAIVLVILLHWFVPDLQKYWVHFFMLRFDELKKMGEPLPAEMVQYFLKVVSPVATGLMGFMVLLCIMLSLILSSRMQYQVSAKSSNESDFLSIRLGLVPIVLVLVVFILAYMQVSVAIDLQRMVIFPFLISGLSLCHYYCYGHRFAVLMLMFLYISFVLFGVMILLVCVLGLLDIGFNFRKRFVRRLS